MSPEQVRGLKADSRSDVFALGCLFYELLTGRRPFDAESMHGVLFKIMQEEPVPVREAAPAIPESLAQIVEKALAKPPADRFASGADMLAALRQARRALAGRSSSQVGDPATPPVPPARGPGERSASRSARSGRSAPPETASRWVVPAAAALALALVGIGGWALRRHVLGPSAPRATPAPVQGLVRKAVDSQVELARRRLDAGHYAEAAREAEQALRLDPENLAARRIADEAALARKAIDGAAAALRDAAGSGDRERIAATAFELMKLDPENGEAEKAAAAAGPAFRGRADEASRLAQDARREAEAGGSSSSAAFTTGVGLADRAARALRSGQPVQAARQFLAARLAFQRARRGRS
jgi:hypothetical protein